MPMNIRDIIALAPVIPELTFTPELAAASRGARFPVVPGVMTPTEVMSARNSNFSVLKLLSLANVACVAGSWVVPQALLLQGDWVGIEALARDAASLAKS
jgi:2-dehydro-3-deoxyphosphogluconate aldolase / (4S)-4-hydroxy-2-oxoglutarate aldolase